MLICKYRRRAVADASAAQHDLLKIVDAFIDETTRRTSSAAAAASTAATASTTATTTAAQQMIVFVRKIDDVKLIGAAVQQRIRASSAAVAAAAPATTNLVIVHGELNDGERARAMNQIARPTAQSQIIVTTQVLSSLPAVDLEILEA